MPDVAFTDDMREISGFGGSYEEACRTMVTTGYEWLQEHADASPEFREYKNIVGMCNAANVEAEQLEDAMVDAIDEPPTGAMVHVCVNHVLTAHNLGWDGYVEEMEETDA